MVEPVYAEVGGRIRQTRKAIGITQAELATRLSVLRSTVANIEAGSQRVALHQLVAIGQAIGVPWQSLCGDVPLPYIELARANQRLDAIARLALATDQEANQ